jgi:hypothetical protein
MQNHTNIWGHDDVITKWQRKGCCITECMDLRYEEKDEGEDNHLTELKVAELMGWKLWSCIHADVFRLVVCHSSRKRQAFEISFTKRIPCFSVFSFSCFFCFFFPSYLFMCLFTHSAIYKVYRSKMVHEKTIHNWWCRVAGSQAHFLFSKTQQLVSSVLLYLHTLFSYLVALSFFFMPWNGAVFNSTLWLRFNNCSSWISAFSPHYLGIIPS